MKDTAADPSNSRMSVSLNCLIKRSHSGSGSSCGSSLRPWVCMRAEASDEERPCVTDVESRCAVSCAERRECAAVIDYSSTC
jgi:hypothetical protein